MLILTEKPSVAKDFAKALGCNFSSADNVSNLLTAQFSLATVLDTCSS